MAYGKKSSATRKRVSGGIFKPASHSARAAVNHRVALMALATWAQGETARLTSPSGPHLTPVDANKAIKEQLIANDVTPDVDHRHQSLFWNRMVRAGRRWVQMSEELGEAVVFLPNDAF